MTSNNTGEKAGPSHGAEVASLELPTPPATTDERTTSPSPSHAADIATPKSASLASPSEIVGIDLNTIGKAEARKIMSEEHKALGFRPPHGSLAAEAQAAAAKHPEVIGVNPPDIETLKEAARLDAACILAERSPEVGPTSVETKAKVPTSPPKLYSSIPEIDLNTISEADARRLMSHEHRALGYRPPPGSLAADAQAAAARHPNTSSGPAAATRITLKDEILREAAVRDAEKIRAMREMETKKDTSEVKKSTSKSPSPKDDNTSQEGKDSTPTPRSGTPFIGCAPPMSRAGTDDSVEIILG